MEFNLQSNDFTTAPLAPFITLFSSHRRKTKITQTIKMSESKITPELVNIYNYDYKIIS